MEIKNNDSENKTKLDFPNKKNSFLQNDIVYQSLNKILDKNKFYSKIIFELNKIEKEKKKNEIQIKTEEISNENIINKDINDLNVIKIFEKSPEKRTYNELLILKNYLLTTELSSYLQKLKMNNESYEKILIVCSTEMKGIKINKNKVVYKTGELSKFLYIIISGKIEKLKPIKIEKEMTGYEYFSHLMQLKKNNEIGLYNMTIKENNKFFFISRDDQNKIQYYYITNILNQIQNGFKINFKEQLDLCNINPEFLGLDSNQINSPNYIIENMKSIFIYIPNLSEEKISFYLFLQDNYLKKKITIFKYKIGEGEILEAKNFFGYSSQIEKLREEEIRTLENSFLIYISNTIYENYLIKGKQSIILKEIDFIRENYIFGKINKKKFEKNYFNLFVIEEYEKDDILEYELMPLKYIYFIKKGEVDLYSKKNPIQIQVLLNELRKVEKNNKNFLNYKYNNLKTNIIEFQNDLKENKLTKIISLRDKEIIGLECAFYGLTNLATSQVSQDKTLIYKITIDNFLDIIKSENEILTTFEKFVKKRLDMLYFRFFNINNVKICLADEKESFRQLIEYEKEFLMNNEAKNKFRRIKDIILDNNKNKQKNSGLPILPKNFSLKKIVFKQNEIESNQLNIKKRNKSNDSLNHHILLRKNLSLFSFEDSMLNKIKNNIKYDENQKNYFLKKENYFLNSLYRNSHSGYNELSELNDINNKSNNQKNENNKFDFFTQLPDVKRNNYNNTNNTNINLNINNNNNNELQDNSNINNNSNSNILYKNILKKRINHPYYEPFVIEKLKKYSIFDQNVIQNNESKEEIEEFFKKYKQKNSNTYRTHKILDIIKQKLKIEVIKKKSILYKNYKNQIKQELINNEN